MSSPASTNPIRTFGRSYGGTFVPAPIVTTSPSTALAAFPKDGTDEPKSEKESEKIPGVTSTPKINLVGAASYLTSLPVKSAANAMPYVVPAFSMISGGTSPSVAIPSAKDKEIKSGKHDPSLAEYVARTQNAAANTAIAEFCCRCKLPMPDECKGLPNCLLESNAFFATKETKCRACGVRIVIGQDLITSMKSGIYKGLFLHRDCALKHHAERAANPEAEVEATLRFHEPAGTLKTLVDEYLQGMHRKLHLEITAGGGKTNAIIYICSHLRAAGASFKVVTYNVKAKEELISRGLRTDEVGSYHSIGMQAYTVWVMSTLQEELIMRGSSTKAGYMRSGTPKVTPTVCSIKVRLLVSLHFALTFPEEPKAAAAATALLRPFIQGLVDQARGHGFGAPGKPSTRDGEALKTLVDKYNLEKPLVVAWSTRLSVPEKMLCDRIMGDSSDARLSYAIACASHVLELCLLTATSLAVGDVTQLFNEKTKKYYDMPVVDYNDMTWLVGMLQLDMSGIAHLLVDERQDTDDAEDLIIQSLCRLAFGSVHVTNVPQMIYQFRGVELETIERSLKGATKLVLAQNFRSAAAINRAAQEDLDAMGIDMTIETVLDLEGLYKENATLHEFPFDLSRTILVICRKTHLAFTFYTTLLAKHYPAQMHGQPETGAEMEKILNRYDGGSMLAAKLALGRLIATTAPSDYTVEHDLITCLHETMVAYERATPAVDVTTPDALKGFVDYMHEIFKPRVGADAGVIHVMSIHAAKGLEAQDVYILQPDLCPLKERLDKGGWEEHEERCVRFVATTRAKERLIKLFHVGMPSREAFLELWQPPAPPEMPSSQDTVDTERASEDEAEEDIVDASDPRVVAALHALGLAELPANVKAVDAAARRKMKEQHPDRVGLNSPFTREHFDKVVKARKVLKMFLGSA